MADDGRAVLDAERVQHVASSTPHVARCGEAWVAYDLHWQETTRLHCWACVRACVDASSSPLAAPA